MQNEGSIKNSLQRLRPSGHKKALQPAPRHAHHRYSVYEQNILKVNSRGSLKNTHSAPNECSIFDFLSFFSAISMPGLRVFSEKPYGNGGEKSHNKSTSRIPIDLW